MGLNGALGTLSYTNPECYKDVVDVPLIYVVFCIQPRATLAKAPEQTEGTAPRDTGLSELMPLKSLNAVMI